MKKRKNAQLTVRQSLSYTPVELSFGTSGLRGLVRDMTSLETYVNIRGFLAWLHEKGEAGSTVYVAGDLRPSTLSRVPELEDRGEIAQAVCRAIEDAGLTPGYLGLIPTPALVSFSARRGAPSIMVTGSHVSAERNGIKLHRAAGELLKRDEEHVLALARRARETEYNRLAVDSLFDERGMFKLAERRSLPTESGEAAAEFLQRYASAFPAGSLAGMRVTVWEHSAVARELLARALAALGAEVVPIGRSERFVPIDTESVSDETIAELEALVRGATSAAGRSGSDADVAAKAGGPEADVAAKAGGTEAGAVAKAGGTEADVAAKAGGTDADPIVVSTDGDGDRPLLLSVEAGRLQQCPGDLLGLLAAEYLGARHVAVPITANDAVDLHCRARGIPVTRTRVGSPFVVEALREVGWEANGGFLTAAALSVPGGGVLAPLPTRDSFLPILATLCLASARAQSVAGLLASLPRRFGSSRSLRDIPQEHAAEALGWLSPPARGVPAAASQDQSAAAGREQTAVPERAEAPAEPTAPSARTAVPTVEQTAVPAAAPAQPVEPDHPARPAAAPLPGMIRDRLQGYFTPSHGFQPVAWVDWMDGVRVGFSNNDIVHLRRSGNAPELRLYSNADTVERARAIVRLTADEILPCMLRDASERLATRLFGDSPRSFPLEGVVQHYAWGGTRFIPSLLGVSNETEKPYAELWMGAHPKAPGVALIDGKRIPLDRLIGAHPRAVLGDETLRRFGAKLPYLFKVLDVRIMASIQAHPSKAQAEAGFARENAQGIPLDAPARNYRDDNHKPEAHVALSDFWLLHGFRPLGEVVEMAREEPALQPLCAGLDAQIRAAGDDANARSGVLKELYARAMTMPLDQVDAILNPLLARLEVAEQQGGLDKNEPGYWALRASRLFERPDGHRDRGILSVYLLNLVKLSPGQGTFQPAGTLHAYLEGVDVEVMASSDNVLRGGLTSKHVDVPELLATLTFREGRPAILEGRATTEAAREYETSAAEFTLQRIALSPGVPYAGGREHGVECIIATDGAAALVSGTTPLTLNRGSIAVVPAGLSFSLAARAPLAVLYKAGVPLAEHRTA